MSEKDTRPVTDESSVGRRPFIQGVAGLAALGFRGTAKQQPVQQKDSYQVDSSGGDWQQVEKLASNHLDEGDHFGYSIELDDDGETALVGAPYDDEHGSFSGTVTVYTKKVSGWQQTATLTAKTDADGDLFGAGVALNGKGDTAIVGAPEDRTNGNNSGSVYVFTKNNGRWYQTERLVAEQGASGDRFGNAVALDTYGKTILIGSNANDDRWRNSGVAYVFRKRRCGWIQDAKLSPSDVSPDGFFGESVALDSFGQKAIVGAPGNDDNWIDSGSAYVFALIRGKWRQTAKLSADDADEDDFFGKSVALDGIGKRALVGAPGDSDNGPDSGSTYLFSDGVGEWGQTAKLIPDDGAFGDYFGKSVAFDEDGETALIGAYGDDEGNSATGSAYVFREGDGSWSPTAKLMADDGNRGDFFGWSVALDGDGRTALAGAPFDQEHGSKSGAAYLFDSRLG